MDKIKPKIEFESEDKYLNAKIKLTDFIEAMNDLTPMQREQLAKEFLTSFGMATSFEQFITYMNNGGANNAD